MRMARETDCQGERREVGNEGLKWGVRSGNLFVSLPTQMEDDRTYFADVLLPLHLPDTYTYRIPRELVSEVKVGVRVVVQFGARSGKMYSALVRRVHCEAPSWRAKYVLSVLDEEAVVDERHMEFWEWMARYYMCYPGDVMQMALPAGMKLASESAMMIHPDFDGELSRLSKYERQVVDLLSQHPVMRIDDIGRALGIQKIMPLVRTMVEREVVMVEEELQERYTPRKSTYVRMADRYADDEAKRALFDSLERAGRTKQVELLMQLMQLSHFGNEAVAKRALPQGSALKTLIKNGVLTTEERSEWRVESGEWKVESAGSIVLSEEQQRAFDVLSGERRTENGEHPGAAACSPLSTLHSPLSTFLLHGVTSSGKTEVYIKLMAREVEAGHQVLFLLPEIALTAQVINRLRHYFGDKVGVYHSRFSASQRVEVWRRTREKGEARLQVLVGARSALFLPFVDLSLVVVDEEHDGSYKQMEPAPRYNARDAAVYMAGLWGARCVLGSATPSIESYHNAMEGKYGLAVMKERYGGYRLPTIECVDMKEAYRKGEVRGNFSKRLLDAVGEALANRQQAILFQNRRGFALRLECDDCHATPHCVHCDVSLVYHKATNSLRCHYCGYSIPVPAECPACHSTRLRMTGIGTERVEEDLQILFPEARVARMDLDSTMQKNQYIEILNDFAERRIDILVGTQMVTKGLDFEHVSVVGIVNADNLINYPSFRSYERAFQQMTQVSGRAGRHGDSGRVILQTYNPGHEVIERVLAADYEGLYREQDAERRVFMYPPYYRLIEITLKHREQEVVDAAAAWLAAQLRATFGNRVLGPEYPLVSRIRALYYKCITLRFERKEPIADAKRVMMQISDDLHKQDGWSGVSVVFDVDPY